MLARDEFEQAVVLLPAGRAALEVGAQAGQRRVGRLARELEFDVAIELLEADIAAHFGVGGSEEPP
ncbi:MAG TPA: hypothetical protein VFV91_11695 [Gaiellaceae bacterium]|nr:hypothetical protein [Gaiellaceae bacterium]